MAVTDAVEKIITECLQPRFAEVMAQARELAPKLVGAPFLNDADVDINAMMRDDQATRNARQAWRSLEPLAAQRRAVILARDRVNMIGHRTPQNDVDGLFAVFRNPEQLQEPGWKPGRPWQRPQPSERQQQNPVLALLWYVTDGAAGTAWCPTTQQQDERWEQLLGEWKRQREQQTAAGQWPRVYANG
jgi:hypothetical protein